MFTSTVSAKGWIVIPNTVRKRYGLNKGTRVHIIDYGGVICVVPVADNPIEVSHGMFRGTRPASEELRKGRREDLESEERRLEHESPIRARF